MSINAIQFEDDSIAEVKLDAPTRAKLNSGLTPLAHDTRDHTGVTGVGDVNFVQVTPAERTAGTEIALRSFSPDDIAIMAGLHGGGGGGGSLSATLAIGNLAGSNGGIVFDGATAADRTLRGVDSLSPTDVTVRGGDEAATGAPSGGASLSIRSGGTPNVGVASGDLNIDVPGSYVGANMFLTVGAGGPGGDGTMILKAPSITLEPDTASATETLSLGGAPTNTISFFGTGGSTQPTITGLVGAADAGLISLLTALDTMGLIVDSTVVI